MTVPAQTFVMIGLLALDVAKKRAARKRQPEPTDTPPVLRAPAVPAAKPPPKR